MSLAVAHTTSVSTTLAGHSAQCRDGSPYLGSGIRIEPGSVRCLAVDSDGCVFDSMTEKHTRVFTPCLIRIWGLEAESDLARELALNINLYSTTRGLNRFAALDLFFERLRERLASQESAQLRLPDTSRLRDWVRRGGPLSQEALEKATREPGGILDQALVWSRTVNEGVAQLPPARPFPAAAETLHALSKHLEIRVVSSANHDALQREWTKAGLADCVTALGGQEQGTKAEQLREASAVHGASAVLMVGDAAGDRLAAQQTGINFFPIRPGHENESWAELSAHLSPP
jgi:phosphoglycolate phosphatase-like HAD superfamily hydrolase